MVNVLLLLFFGALTGWIASLLTATDRTWGLLVDIIIGVAGAVLGGYMSRNLGSPDTSFNSSSLVVAIFGAVILLSISRLARGGSSHHV